MNEKYHKNAKTWSIKQNGEKNGTGDDGWMIDGTH